MKESVKATVRKILDNYLETSNRRKTPERYAILDAVYSIGGHFSLEQLGECLEKQKFRVSRATLYNTMHLFIQLRLVTRHNLMNGTTYEAWYDNRTHCHQICTVCGKVTEINVPEINEAIENAHLRRFRKDGFSLYIYGICSSCQARITRRITTDNKLKTKDKTK